MRAQANNKESESYPVVLSYPLEIREEGKGNRTVNKGVDKTRNTEHSGTFQNIPKNEKIKVIFMKKKIIK